MHKGAAVVEHLKRVSCCMEVTVGPRGWGGGGGG